MRFIPWLISWPTDIYRILRPAGGELRSLDGDELDEFMRQMYPPTAADPVPEQHGTTLNLRVGTDESN